MNYQRPSITRNAAWLVAALLVVLLAAVATGSVPIIALGLLSFLVAFAGLALPFPPSPVLRRTVSKTNAWVNEALTVTWELEVARGFGVVVVYDPLPVEMELVSGSNLRIFWKGLAPVTLTNTYQFRCPKRGSWELPPTSWEVRHPLELRQADSGAGGEVVSLGVLPRLQPIRRIHQVRGVAKTPQPMSDLARVGVLTTDFKEIRSYVPGDPIHTINWKASARLAAAGDSVPLVNDFEREGKKSTWLFCDASTYMEVGTSVQNPLEHAVEAASALGYYYLTRGYQMGAHFSSRPQEIVHPDTGRVQLHRLSRRLLDLKAEGGSYDLLRAVMFCRAQLLRYTPHCYIITRLDADQSRTRGIPPLYEGMLQGISRLLSFSPGHRRRINVSVVAIDAHHYSAGESSMHSIASSISALETRPTIRELRRRGVSVMQWNPLEEGFGSLLMKQLRRG